MRQTLYLMYLMACDSHVTQHARRPSFGAMLWQVTVLRRSTLAIQVDQFTISFIGSCDAVSVILEERKEIVLLVRLEG